MPEVDDDNAYAPVYPESDVEACARAMIAGLKAINEPYFPFIAHTDPSLAVVPLNQAATDVVTITRLGL